MSMMELVQTMKKDAQAQERLVSVFSQMLDETVKRNDSLQRRMNMASFEGTRPAITASAYVRRIVKYGGLSPCCFVVGLIYLERLKRRDHTVCLTSQTFQRLLLVAVMEAAKFLDDFYYSNKHWAEIGGLKTVEINALELEFIFRLGFSLFVSREEYDHYAAQLLALDMTATPAAAPVAAADATMVDADARCTLEHGRTPGARAFVQQTHHGVNPSMAGADEKGKEDVGLDGKKIPSYCNITDASALFGSQWGPAAMVE